MLSPLMTFCQERRLSKKAIELLGLRGDESVIDIGCGTGTLTIEISKELSQKNASRDFLVRGLDAAPRMIEIARKKSRGLKNIYFDIEPAEQLPYKDESFDLAVSTFFFHHVNFELKKRSLQELWRVIKKDGKVVIVDIDTPTNFLGALCAWCGYIIFRQEEIRENIHGRLREAFEYCGFRSWHKVSSHQGYISIFQLVK